LAGVRVDTSGIRSEDPGETFPFWVSGGWMGLSNLPAAPASGLPARGHVRAAQRHEARLNEPPVGSEAQSSRFRVVGLYLIEPGLLGRLVKRLDEHVHAPEAPEPVTLQVLPRSGGNRRGFS